MYNTDISSSSTLESISIHTHSHHHSSDLHWSPKDNEQDAQQQLGHPLHNGPPNLNPSTDTDSKRFAAVPAVTSSSYHTLKTIQPSLHTTSISLSPLDINSSFHHHTEYPFPPQQEPLPFSLTQESDQQPQLQPLHGQPQHHPSVYYSGSVQTSAANTDHYTVHYPIESIFTPFKNSTGLQHNNHSNSSSSSCNTTSPSPSPSSSSSYAAMGSDDGHSMFINPCADGHFIVRALHEYHTDSVGHLSFSQFQYIKVKHCEESGWWLGESENSRGWFPSNRVERVAPVYEAEYSSRPASITSEDYDQIRNGLDGVETQFLGEPVAEPVSDSIQQEWGARSPSLGRSRAGQLAFPPSQLSSPMGYHPSTDGVSPTDIESALLFPQSMGSLSEVGGGDMSYAYSDFVAEVTVYVRELREATARAEIDRYQPIVANIISCVKALLIFTNTIARDSDVLQTYSELSKSRRTILRALGKLYSKCRVANGSQAMTTARQRQFAAEKLGIFAEQVLSGITEFTTRAREIGLRMATETIAAATTSTGELDMVLMASAGDIAVPSPPSSTSTAHSRPRRRVSRANSAKGYKSFNAVRQWKAEHQHKHNAAKQAVEQLLSEYMECLSEANGTTRLDRILSITIQTAQSVEIFIISADDMRSRANVKDDQDYAAYRAQLSATSNELYEYIKFLGPRGFSDEGILNKLMSLGTIMLRCLIDMEPHAPGSRRGSLAPIPEPVMPKIPSSMLMAASAMDSTANGQKDNHEPQFMESETPSKSRASRSPSRHRTNSNRKFGSISSLNERYKRQATGNGGQSSPDKEAAMSFLDSAYEGNEPEKKHVESHRPNQDSPVAVSSRVTQHQNIVAPQMGTVITVAIDEEAEDRRMESSEISGEPPKKSTVEQGRIPKGAERKIAAIIVPDMSQIKEEVVVPSPHSSRYRFEQDPDAPPTPSLRPQYTAHTSPSITGSRSPRMRASDSDSRAPSSRRRTSGRTDRTDRTDRLERTERVDRSERSERTDRYDRGDRSERRERPRSPAEFENSAISKDGDGIGLGVSVPAETRPKITSPSIGPSSGSSAVSRSSRAAGSSPNLEATRRTQRQEQPPRAHSPGPDLRPFSRNSNNSSTSLSPAGASSSRRGSQTSIRSEGSTGRRSNESQRVRDVDHQDRRHQAPRRGSGSASTLRVEQTKGDDVLAGLSTPSTPQVQSFVESSNSQRSGRHPHRESTQSNMSVATVSSVQSKGSGRPVSPPRSRNGQQDGSTKGRASIESIRGSDRHQHHPQSQQTKGPSSASGYRPRQNKVGQAKFPASGDDNRPEAPPAEPWFLEHDYESDEVLYNDNGTLIAATLDAYIEMLTSHKSQPEPMFMTTFFTTFRLFTDPLDLVQLLTRRFLKSPPSGLSEQDYAIWQQQKQERIQKRVHTAFKTWLEGYWVTDRDRAAFKPIMEFVKQEMMEVLPSSAGRLLEILNQWANKRKSLHSSARASTIGKSRSHDRISQVIQEQSSPHSPTSGSSISNAFSRPFATVKEKYSADQLKNAGKKGISPFSNRDSIQSRGPPVPLVNKALLSSLANEQTMTKVPITDIKPLELARQLTIMVGKLFLDIPYLELLGRERPNCSRMVQVSNKVTIWVTDTIVDEQDVKKRIGVVKHWIEVGEECLKLNNFDTLTAISCAIESTPVRRLHNTWEGISKTYVERAEQLRKMISSEFNYSVYRAKLKTVQSPCIPFLGLYFTVIAYIEDGNSIYKEINPQGTAPNSTSSTASTATTATNTTATTNTQQQQPNTPTPTPTRKLLRYGRFAQLARAVQEFRDFQGVYELLEVPRLRDYIMKCMENQDSERSYRKSLAIEPRRPAPGVIQPSPGSNMGPNSGNQRSNSSNKGLFQAISNSSDSSNGASGGIPNKLNKLSFFRKSTRVERI